MTKEQRTTVKKLQEKLSISLLGYNKRIEEEKRAIKEAKKNIKKYKILKKQAKNTSKLELMEL